MVDIQNNPVTNFHPSYVSQELLEFVGKEDYAKLYVSHEDCFQSTQAESLVCSSSSTIDSGFVTNLLTKMEQINKLPEFNKTSILKWDNIPNNFYVAPAVSEQLLLLYYDLLQYFCVKNKCKSLAFIIVEKEGMVTVVISYSHLLKLDLDENESDISYRINKRIKSLNAHVVRPTANTFEKCIKIEF